MVKLQLHDLHYNLGCVLHQQGDLAAAAVSYRQAIALNPDDGNAYRNLGWVLAAQGQQTAAIQVYRQAIARLPGEVKTYNDLGCLLIQQGRFAEAVELYQRAIALQPHEALLHNNLGQALAPQHPAAAIGAYRKAVALDPTLAQTHYNLGLLWQQQQEHAAAIACFQQVLQLHSAEALAVHTLADAACGVSYLALGQVQQALGCWRQAIAPQAEWIAAYCEWVEQRPAADDFAQARWAGGRFLRALQQDAEHPTVPKYLAQAYLHLGNALMAYGGDRQYQQAERFYQRSLQLQPDQGEAYLRLGDCLAQQDRLSAALMVYHLAQTRQPDLPQIALAIGQVLERQQHWERAIAIYRTVFSLGQPGQALAQTATLVYDRPAGTLTPPQPRPRSRTVFATTWDWAKATGVAPTAYMPLSAPVASDQAAWRTPSSDGAETVPCSPLPSLSSCEGLNCIPCLNQIANEFEPLRQGEKQYTLTQTAAIAPDPFPLFVATIPAGQVWAAPQKNLWQICNAIAVLTAEGALLADLSRDYPGQLPGCQQFTANRHRIWQEPLPEPTFIQGTVAVLSGLSGHVYFHWMVDILPRFKILRESGHNLADVDYVLVNSQQSPFQQETLALLGLSPDRLLESDRYPYIQASQLIVPSFAGHLGWMQPWALSFLRQTLLPLADSTRSQVYPDRIYISRSQAQYRRVLNEPAVLDLLQSFGFVSVVLESLSLAEQIALFAHAKVVMAPHGSGLTNLAFCQPGTKVIELVSPRYIRHYFWVISNLLNLNHTYLMGEKLPCHPIRELIYPNPLIEDIWVDLSALKEVITRFSL